MVKLSWCFLLGGMFFALLAILLILYRNPVSPPFEIFSDMVRQPRFNPQTPSDFFTDGRSARPPVVGTVPLGYAAYLDGKGGGDFDFGVGSSYRTTGKFGARWGAGIPLEVNGAFMQRGRERFSIHCAVCHGATGWGDGIATKYGLIGVANLQLARIRSMPDGQIFDVITHGKNFMMALGSKISVSDRWAIIAYLRALQRSQQTGLSDMSAIERAKLESLP